MEGLDFNNVTFKSLIGFSNFTISRREMEIEIWFTSQMKGTHVVLTQTFFALLSMEWKITIWKCEQSTKDY